MSTSDASTREQLLAPTREQWLAARKELLAAEKALDRARDALAEKRRALPAIPVERDYRFGGEGTEHTLAELFGGKSQLIVYHFMFGPDAEAGCRICSFWADHFDAARPHLHARDAELVAVSRGPVEKLHAYRARMGWHFPWYSSGASTFNYDFDVSFTAAQIGEAGAPYNFGSGTFRGEDAPGLSVFQKDARGRVLHTYSTYARGLDMLNGTYHLMDVLPKGRDEQALPHSMAWLKRKDEYEHAHLHAHAHGHGKG